MRLRHSIFAAIVPFLAWSATAGAPCSARVSSLARPPAFITVPHADLEVFSSDHVLTDWSGKGDAEATIDLCVTSTTGRFRLQVATQGADEASGQSKLAYEVSFRDSSGAERMQPFRDNTILTFEGVSRADSDCAEGPNATLKIASRETQMRGLVSGRYFDRLIMSASPL